MATAETSILYQIGIHTTAETSCPTVPARYSHMSLSGAGFTVIGSRDRGDDADLDEDTVNLAFSREDVDINPPLSLTAKDSMLRKAGADVFEFVAYGGNEELMELDSDMSVASHVVSFGTTRTKRTVIVEVNGHWVDYYPNCVVKVTQIPAGLTEGGVGRTRFSVRPLGTSSIGGGWQRKYFS